MQKSLAFFNVKWYKMVRCTYKKVSDAAFDKEQPAVSFYDIRFKVKAQTVIFMFW